ncbi:hypothetical protein EXU57_02365 [Segetibacter sp. 3557_3]|uniref:hypothetical protein n=1 Tax=Segetibacter sp. 3557_3 TaxID=2547429 RepID=UPI0010586462|nr:hypothetical protein [Segetibacter sp. 3557_3]TDH28938.1 hypothetical protein EXU57_02365 [Segetibacter sp. 3557_3]
MKYCMLLSLLISYTAVQSQEIKLYKPGGLAALESKKEYIAPKPLMVKPAQIRQQANGSMPVLRMENKAKLSEKTRDGSEIYIMLTDNMPCLVPAPGANAKMPGVDKRSKESLLQVVPQK